MSTTDAVHPTGKPPEMRLHIEERFWSKVDHGDEDECWEWTAATHNGYGAFRVGGSTINAHRVAYALDAGIPAGSIDSDTDIRHSVCHRTTCCNPAHLSPGTRSDNMQDSVRDGRIGGLDDADVRDIRAAYHHGDATQVELADEYDRAQSAIHHIIHGEYYEHVPMPPYDE